MGPEAFVSAAAAVGVTVGLVLQQSRQRAQVEAWKTKIVAEIGAAGALTLPELVVKLGLKDGFMSRGKVMTVLNPLVASGQLTQEEPPGTTMKNRLSVLRFSAGVAPRA
jgi:hypothetical protein